VHGLDRFYDPVLLTDEVVNTLATFDEISPLHNPPALTTIRAAKRLLGPTVPLVGVFDTGFHKTIPPKAAQYALPSSISQKYHLRRYGFHGLAHEYMLRQYAKLSGLPVTSSAVVSLQLGSGCSACAIKDGRSVDTSMGFTPVSGLVMRTRSGDLDPGILEYLLRAGAIAPAEMESILNHKSGMAGVSQTSGDMQELLSRRATDPNSELAISMFCYQVQKYIASYMAVAHPVQAIIFGGGIGENVPDIRAQILDNQFFGVNIASARNYDTLGKDGKISSDDSRVAAYVIAVDESSLIAEYSRSVLK
jgi:acetate kinase